MKALFHQSQNEKKSYGTNLKTSEVHDAITLHPVKETKRMHKLYVYLLELKAQELLEMSTNLQSEIQETTKLLFCLTNQDMEQSNASLSMNYSLLSPKSIHTTDKILFGLETNAMSSSTPEKLSSFTFRRDKLSF